MTLFHVALKISHNHGVFTYRLADACSDSTYIGRRVRVSIRNRDALGVIVSVAESSELTSIKDIVEVIDDRPVITPEQFALMKFCSDYYFNPFGLCVHLATPRDEKKPRIPPVKPPMHKPLGPLTPDQTQAVQKILDGEHFGYLLEGVTGSGKTHVYITVAEAMIRQGKSVLFLVPEISLTPQLVDRVENALGQKALVMHSNITPQKKTRCDFCPSRKAANLDRSPLCALCAAKKPRANRGGRRARCQP